MLHQQEVVLEQTANQQKLQATAEYIAKRRALLADMGGLDSKDPEAQKLMKEIQQANLQMRQLTNERAQIEQKGNQTMLRDQIASMKEYADVVKETFSNLDNTVASSFAKWGMHQKSLGAAWAESWNRMAEVFIQNMIKMAMQEALMHALHISLKQKEIMVDAKKAASGAYSATADIPYVGPILAPIAAATAFAGVMALASFDIGGVVPKTQVALVHGGERVLTESQNSMFERAIAQGGGGHTFNHTFNVSGVGDPETVARRASDMAVASMKASFRSNGVARR